MDLKGGRMESKVDISTIGADAEAIRIIAGELCQEVSERQYYLAHAIYALAEHQLSLMEDA